MLAKIQRDLQHFLDWRIKHQLCVITVITSFGSEEKVNSLRVLTRSVSMQTPSCCSSLAQRFSLRIGAVGFEFRVDLLIQLGSRSTKYLLLMEQIYHGRKRRIAFLRHLSPAYHQQSTVLPWDIQPHRAMDKIIYPICKLCLDHKKAGVASVREIYRREAVSIELRISRNQFR